MATKKTQAANRSLLGYGSVKAAADGSIMIEGFANKNVVDRGDEIISTDAWKLDNFKKNPVILLNHGMDPQIGSTPVGVATEVRPTKDGLFIKAKLSQLDDPVIKRIRGLVEERILRAFSVGFNPLETETDQKTGARKITSAELFEVSIVGVPMNQDSLFELSGKMLQKKSMHQIKRDVLKKKGAWVAGAVHNRIYELQKNDRLDREAALEQVASMADVDMDLLMDVLAGNVTPVPEPILVALSETLAMELDQLKELDQGDVDVEDDLDTTEEETDDSTEEETSSEESTEEEASEEGDGEEESSEGGETAAASDGSDKEYEEEDHNQENPDEEQGTRRSAKPKKSFQDCVSAKIPKLIEEGMDQEQAVATAISMCQNEEKSIKPSKANYVEFFRIADLAASKKNHKQADQGEEVSQATSEIAAASKDGDTNFGSPHLEAINQTNILLGALINEMQMLRKQMLGQAAVEEPKPAEENQKKPEENQEPTDEESKTDAGMEDEESEASEEDKAKFADPVGKSYPISSKEEVESSLSLCKTKAFADRPEAKRRKVYRRIIEKALELGIELDFDESCPLTQLLPIDLKDKLRESHNNAEVKLLDSYRKRLENVKDRLSKLEA